MKDRPLKEKQLTQQRIWLKAWKYSAYITEHKARKYKIYILKDLLNSSIWQSRETLRPFTGSNTKMSLHN